MIILPLYIWPSPGISKLNIPANKGSLIELKVPPILNYDCEYHLFQKNEGERNTEKSLSDYVRAGFYNGLKKLLFLRIGSEVGIDHIIYQTDHAAWRAECVAL